ncbi:MAG: hypothetical protein Q9164_002488 [Protoblastenia rupestris]
MLLDTLWKRETAEDDSSALPINPVQYCILAAGTAIAWAYTIELDLLILYTFRRRKGLYFWSLLISSWGCTLHAIGFILNFLVGTSWLLYLPFIEVGTFYPPAGMLLEHCTLTYNTGWVTMVTGQAFVLFSRLHLVVRNRRTLRLVLLMIIFNAFVFHVPMIVFTYGNNSPNADYWYNKFHIMERIQLTGFCIQEFIIATVYIVATVRLLGSIYHSMTRKVMLQLLIINFICIGMDIVLICLEFTGNYISEASIKPMIYAIKLKLEFAVLNQLMGLTKAGFTEENNFQGRHYNHGHELRSSQKGPASNNDPEGAFSPKKQGTWTTARAIRGSFSGTAAQAKVNHPEHIYQTKQVDVMSQPKSPSGGDVSTSSTSTAIGSAGAGPPVSTGPKVNSLMGTSIVHMPEAGQRNSRRSRAIDPDGREASPVSEGEARILRRSQDSEKEGTRWIDGLDHH